MTDEKGILSLLRRGWSERRIARETGHHRSAIRRVRREAGLGPKRTTATEVTTDPAPSAEGLTDRTVSAKVSTESSPTRSTAEPHRSFIAAELDKRRNATAIYQDLVEHHGYTGSYQAVKRLARKLRKDTPKVSCRYETAPGQEMQVDYGDGALTRDPRTGKYRRPHLLETGSSF